MNLIIMTLRLIFISETLGKQLIYPLDFLVFNGNNLPNMVTNSNNSNESYRELATERDVLANKYSMLDIFKYIDHMKMYKQNSQYNTNNNNNLTLQSIMSNEGTSNSEISNLNLNFYQKPKQASRNTTNSKLSIFSNLRSKLSDGLDWIMSWPKKNKLSRYINELSSSLFNRDIVCMHMKRSGPESQHPNGHTDSDEVTDDFESDSDMSINEVGLDDDKDVNSGELENSGVEENNDIDLQLLQVTFLSRLDTHLAFYFGLEQRLSIMEHEMLDEERETFSFPQHTVTVNAVYELFGNLGNTIDMGNVLLENIEDSILTYIVSFSTRVAIMFSDVEFAYVGFRDAMEDEDADIHRNELIRILSALRNIREEALILYTYINGNLLN